MDEFPVLCLTAWWFQTCFIFIFHNIWDVILPIDELHHFSRWLKPPTNISYTHLISRAMGGSWAKRRSWEPLG